ncbi:MAG: hypothetical protein ACXACA_06920, partial [Candidatus Ranarchaeia archaeon]
EENRATWINKLKDSNKSIEVIINRKRLFEKIGENTQFIKQVKNDIICANANQGIPNMMGKGYVRSIPILWLSEFARSNIRHRIRLGLDYLIYDSILKKKFQEAYRLSKLLVEFDRSHYDHFLILARICHQLGKKSEARDNYNIAIGICKDDPNWNKRKRPEDVQIEEIIENIEKELSDFKAKRA